ncbi:probable WRKY transcription factor 14 [Salvia splendens]|uniref:probable WRKY transcription factor 14 n=1 Tax=Salvia splendens TaxID=180675 RepID=UPI001C26A1DD|nr:probable WRKY transcription factor 14 [Salvia splendens]XP_042022513.1 probable WRKY transcription factor 14 [Salvia splendens]
MCSRDLLKWMENYNQGDLTDIIRATGGANPPAETPAAAPEWQFPTNPIAFSAADFGDPFAQLGDPLIHAPPPPPPLPGFFDMIKPSDAAGMRFGGNSNLGQKISLDKEMKRPPNIFSRMLQISPTAKLPIPLSPCDSSPAAAGAPMLVANDHHALISPSYSSRGNCLIESSLQISSPRNAGIRRRKSQAKKVVCIPAPAPANSRPSGEIVPSDLWAWRKYGQKPIKGSPYPRGYYRCSSSKGCSARKQVERSRTDPNMLVITYTSEHNHPWPTQRNALAGSTRSQPSKTAAAKTSPKPKDEQKETSTETAAPSSTNSAAVKEEVDQEFDNNNNQTMEAAEEAEFDDEFSQQSYKPALPESNQNEDSFFAGLGEIEADSLDLLFIQGFDGRDHGGKGLDPFGFYDWGGTTTAAAAASSGGAGGEDEGDS